MTVREVVTMVRIGRCVAFRREGTMIKPPPTPSRPERKPTATPDSASDLAQWASQTSQPVKWSSWQGVAGDNSATASAGLLFDCLNILIAT